MRSSPGTRKTYALADEDFKPYLRRRTAELWQALAMYSAADHKWSVFNTPTATEAVLYTREGTGWLSWLVVAFNRRQNRLDRFILTGIEHEAHVCRDFDSLQTHLGEMANILKVNGQPPEYLAAYMAALTQLKPWKLSEPLRRAHMTAALFPSAMTAKERLTVARNLAPDEFETLRDLPARTLITYATRR